MFALQFFKLVPRNDEENILLSGVRRDTPKQAFEELSEGANTKKGPEKVHDQPIQLKKIMFQESMLSNHPANRQGNEVRSIPP